MRAQYAYLQIGAIDQPRARLSERRDPSDGDVLHFEDGDNVGVGHE